QKPGRTGSPFRLWPEFSLPGSRKRVTDGLHHAYQPRCPRGDAHRITLLTPVNPTTGKTGFGSIDGSTYNPFTDTLLFTQEAGSSGGVIQVTTSWAPTVNTLDASRQGRMRRHPLRRSRQYLHYRGCWREDKLHHAPDQSEQRSAAKFIPPSLHSEQS